MRIGFMTMTKLGIYCCSRSYDFLREKKVPIGVKLRVKCEYGHGYRSGFLGSWPVIHVLSTIYRSLYREVSVEFAVLPG